MAEKKVGVVEHYFDRIHVAAINITEGTLKVGDTIHFKGNTSDFQQKVDSMQIEHNEVTEAKPGESVGMKVTDRVRPHDVVYVVTPD